MHHAVNGKNQQKQTHKSHITICELGARISDTRIVHLQVCHMSVVIVTHTI
jgi:hypothetical protein